MDLNRMLDGLANSGVIGGLAGGALAGALTSKSGRKTAGKLFKLGGVAAIGGLAWSAYRRYSATQSRLADRNTSWRNLPRERFDVDALETPQRKQNGLLIIRAMITAAMSDGHLDSSEQIRVFDQADKLALNGEDKALLFDELRHPRPVRHIVEAVDSPALAVEVYAASVLAIDELTFEGQSYLRRLAGLLNLPADLAGAVHDEANAAIDDHRAA